MKTKRMKLFSLIALAVVLLSGAAGAGYAYWAGSVTAPTAIDKNYEVTVGTGSAVASSLSTGDVTGSGTLVPEDQARDGQVEYVILTVDVSWKETIVQGGSALAKDHSGTLSAALKEGTLKINSATTYANLANVSLQVGGTAPSGGTLGNDDSTIILDGDAVTVYVKVTLTEPGSAAIYNAVAGKSITFDVTFSVTPETN